MARPTRRKGNLPAEATSFVGRRREIAELRKKLTTARLVSLVGPGGVGKTRLAIRGATDLARGFAAGAWMVELAEVRDPDLVPNALLAALDLRDQTATEPLDLLLSYLQDKQLLLVIDNCEHLLGAASKLVSEVITAAPGVRVVATSREPLSVPGEHLLPVPPLKLPAAHAAEPLNQLRQNEAVMLFTERAGAASGTFELSASNQAAVADVCRRLDGLPLAIELAAVRTRVLSIEQILARLTDRFALLTVGGRGALPRHQTLQTTIDWSYDLLSAEEQTLFRRLCVFAGRFTLEDVDGVSAEGLPNPLDLLSSLVDKSLVIKEEVHGVACFRLHETMREYAILKLRDAAEEEALGERCIDYYWSRCLPAGAAARYRLVEWLEWMELEIDNLRAVMRHCISRGDYARGVDLVTSLGWFWITRGTTEGARWLDELLAHGQGNRLSLAWATFLRGFLAVLQADPLTAGPWLDRAAEAARELRDNSMLTQALTMGSVAATFGGDRVAAAVLFKEAEAAAAGVDDPAARSSVLQAKVLNAMFDGELEVVRTAASEGVRISRETGDLYVLDVMLMELAFSFMIEGQLDIAKPLYVEALRAAQRIDDRILQSYLLVAFGYFAAGSRQATLAAQLFGAAESVRIGAGANIMLPMAPFLAQAEESAIAVLGRAKFEAEYTTGKRLSRELALRLALGEPAEVLTADGEGAGLLGKREADVAKLVAEGLSNKQIGARLFISERTVDSHVRSILNKLGFNSRAQIASWVASSDR